ncbi:hemocyte protein-glutamine gamma-glutamyltransferase-like [Rhodnius prolixus]
MALKVSSVNLFPVENAKSHRTFKYEAVHLEPPALIFRRGQEFVFDILFTGRVYSDLADKLRVLMFYEDEQKLRTARGGAWLTNQQEELDDMESWSLRMVSKEGNSIKLKMRTPINCPIGSWKLTIKTSLKAGIGNNTYDHPESIFILLNPWHFEDEVYMPDTHLLEEYVMNDIGKVYTGRKGRHWLFGQFEAHVLQACRKLLKESGVSFNDKGDPVLLARMISKMVNSNDDDGVLTGNWSGYYSDGTNPSLWTGSSPILKEYLETGGGVKYGQCWVFAAVVCTVCRALGMPARVVTNLYSAHDTDSTLTIDKFFTEDGDVDEAYDSVWNFHVWNDVWMARPDLPAGYGGWQAIDATPQEYSEDVFQCGPASVVAIKKGEVGFQYDMPFILAEVNADLIDWQEDEEALLGYKKIKTDTKHVGKHLLTKKPHIFDPCGDRDKDDVMHEYKDAEGSKEERLSLLRAAFKCGDKACEYFEVDKARDIQEIKFSIHEIETINIGNSFTIAVDMENTIEEKRTVQIALSLWSIYYTGVKGHTIKKVCETIEIPSKEKKQLKVYVTLEEYLDKLVEFSLLKTHVIATVEETKQTWSDENEFQITKPSLTVEAATLEVNKPGKIFFIFTNPLKKKLTECLLAFECHGIVKHQKMPYRDTLPEETIKIETTFTPTLKGKFALVAIFFSKELQEILGAADIDVA